MTAFVPKRGLANGHVMTIYAWARPRSFPRLPRPESRCFQVTNDTQVKADCYWQPNRTARPTVLGLHGLEGSSAAHYMRGVATEAWQRGWNAVLLNQRNCGGTEHLAPGLYHSGLTHDAAFVVAELAGEGLPHFGVVGYSLGGNITLKLAGEMGTMPERGALPIRAVAAVSPTMDLDVCSRALDLPSNFPYQWNFVRNLRARMRRKAALWPGAFDITPLGRIGSIRAFDDRYTAPLNGFDSVDDYYYRASARRVVAAIPIPALIIAADDDPFVPAEQFSAPEIAGNANIRVALTRGGGHCGFVGRDGYWAESAAVSFLAGFMPS
jgi:predicted alpha/beta-fold hydrolase